MTMQKTGPVARKELCFDGLFPWQEKVLASSAPRIIAATSRQAGKTTLATMLAARYAYNNPQSLVLVCTPTLRQGKMLAEKVFPLLDLPSKGSLECNLTNGSQVVFVPDSPDAMRGHRPHCVVLDDATSITEETGFLLEAYSASCPEVSIVLLSTPKVGRRGFFYRIWSSNGAWERHAVPAYELPTISVDYLLRAREELGENRFKAEYMAEFVDSGEPHICESYD